MFNADFFNQFHESESYQAGEILIGEGDPGETIYAIQQGEVQVVHKGELLATLGPGELVGEMAWIDQMPRSATVIALTDVRVVPVDPDRFFALLQKTPIFGTRVMTLISSRLRRAAGLEPLPQAKFHLTE